MSKKRYPTDLTDKEWALLEPLLPPAKTGGRNRSIETREIANAIFYLLRTGCSWRMLPQDFPKWQTVYTYFRNWKNDGTWQKVNEVLRRKLRTQEGRDEEPSAGILDSQSTKTAEKGDLVVLMRVRKSTDENGTSW
jgi:putative transposase